MLKSPWHVGPEELSALRGYGGARFTEFADALVRAEATLEGIPVDRVTTNIRVNIGDGGVDTQVKVPLRGALNIEARPAGSTRRPISATLPMEWSSKSSTNRWPRNAFPTVIAEITPDEFERVRRAEIKLPEGWSLANVQKFDRPRVA